MQRDHARDTAGNQGHVSTHLPVAPGVAEEEGETASRVGDHQGRPKGKGSAQREGET